MNSNDNKYKICPKCGSKLIDVSINSSNICSLCTESTCRTVIKDNIISEMEIDMYSTIQQKIKFKREQYDSGIRAYMLLKEDLSAPLLTKNTNSPFIKERTAYNIIKANSFEDAKKQFKDKFQFIKVSDDMVVEISIKEIDT